MIKSKMIFESFKMNSIIDLFNDFSGLTIRSGRITFGSKPTCICFCQMDLHGNPRQCKRFLNSMDMRIQMASYKNKKLNRKILAKIMMLEYIKPKFLIKLPR